MAMCCYVSFPETKGQGRSFQHSSSKSSVPLQVHPREASQEQSLLKEWGGAGQVDILRDGQENPTEGSVTKKAVPAPYI